MVSALSIVTTQLAPVLANLARALIPALDHPERASALFIDQLAAATGTHVVQKFGDRVVSTGTRTRKLSRAQENVAKSLMLDNLHGDVPVAELAHACSLTRGYFIHAFRETTGMTPYQRPLREMVAQARAMLLDSSSSLSEVAISFGFPDQSHFTPVFANAAGTTPGIWRRNA
jgi:AraC family transcriptional regulator